MQLHRQAELHMGQETLEKSRNLFIYTEEPTETLKQFPDMNIESKSIDAAASVQRGCRRGQHGQHACGGLKPPSLGRMDTTSCSIAS